MAEMWMPGAQRRDVGNFGEMEGGPSRATHHTTSNPNDWNFENERDYFSDGGALVAPHLLVDPFTGQMAITHAASSPADSRRSLTRRIRNRPDVSLT